MSIGTSLHGSTSHGSTNHGSTSHTPPGHTHAAASRLTAGPFLAILSLIVLDAVPHSPAAGAIAERQALVPVVVLPPVAVTAAMPDPVEVAVRRLSVPPPPARAYVRQSEAAKATTPAPSHHRPVLTSTSLCMSPGSDSACEATFAQALQTGIQRDEDDLEDVVVRASGTANVVGPRGAEPLHFQKRAPWVRRLETLGKEGIPFVRIPQGPQSELVVGINRKGVLGFSLKQTRNP